MKKARRLSNNRLLEAIKTILSHHRTFPSRRQTTRQAAMRALDKWMTRFRAITRDALRDQPDYLEKLGILARS